MLQNLLMNALVYVVIDQGIHKGKMKVALNEKRKKLRGFSFSINIANFEAFLSVFKLTKNPLFLKSADLYFENKRRPATEPKSKYNISKIFLNLEICQKMRSNISKYSKIKG